MTCQVKTPGKLILIGEYAVLEGAPAMVLAVNRYARINITQPQGIDFTVQSPTLGIAKIPFQITSQRKLSFPPEIPSAQIKLLSFFTDILEYFLQHEKNISGLPAYEISLNTQEFYLTGKKQKLGLGSSAALTVGLVQGILYLLNRDDIRVIDPHHLFSVAEQIHFQAQGGKGSGIDIASSCFGGLILFQRLTDRDQYSFKTEAIEFPDDLKILPVWTGISASTPEKVRQVQKLREKNRQTYNSILINLTEISQKACVALMNQDTSQFIIYCKEYDRALKELSEASKADIISPVHETISRIVSAEGAVYKPSGAGGGDIGLAFTQSSEIAQHVSDKLLRSGFEILNLGPSFQGSMIESKDISKRGE